MGNILILIVSGLIYLNFGKFNIIYILFSTVTSFWAAKHLKGKYDKLILTGTIVINLSILLFFKLANLIPGINGANIIAPLGISYYTLQIISYLVDVYKGKYDCEQYFFRYLLYVMYFPYIFIGPITRYNEIAPNLFHKITFQKDNIYEGFLRILWGLFKKFLIAARISLIINVITSRPDIYCGSYALLAMILYSIELYSDFSGGIDIVIGVSKIFGIVLKENFNLPFGAETVQEFWRRWHISLSNWLKDYVYIPLGGNRVNKWQHKLNLITTFVVSGLWHGPTYILWGLFHGIIVSFNNLIKTPFSKINTVITFLIVSLLWSFFIWTNSSILPLQMIVSVFTNFNYANLFHNFLDLGLDIPNIVVLIISIIILIVYDLKQEVILKKIKNISLEIKVTIICSLIIIILLLGVYGIGFNVNDFIYSKF